jgi:hypothetical protein
MFAEGRIRDVQKRLADHNIDGWLIYDFQKRNELASTGSPCAASR